MNIIVGKLAGFCGGVVNSVTKTEKLLDEYNKMKCLGELVHNKQVVDKLESKGLNVVSSLSEVLDGEKLIIRAHGVPKEIYEEADKRNIELFDLTCPKVLKIHEQAEELVKNDYFIILIAQKDHPEAIGTISFCGDNCVILESIEEIDSIMDLVNESSCNKVAIISQTTFSVKKFNDMVDALKDKIVDKELVINNTICSATDLRQKETKEMATKVDAMIIIGGKNSSNTKKLYEIAKKELDDTFIVETVEDLENDFSKYKVVGVMAGASTPKESIEEVVKYLEKI